MNDQFCLTAYPENAVLVDLATRRIVDWFESPTIEVYLFTVDGRYPTNDAWQLFLFNNPSLFLSLINATKPPWWRLKVTYNKFIKSHLSTERQRNHYRTGWWMPRSKYGILESPDGCQLINQFLRIMPGSTFELYLENMRYDVGIKLIKEVRSMLYLPVTNSYLRPSHQIEHQINECIDDCVFPCWLTTYLVINRDR